MKCGYRLFTVLLVLLAGCKFGPNYKRPKVDTPSVYRADAQAAQGVSIAEEKWWTVFQDPAVTATDPHIAGREL